MISTTDLTGTQLEQLEALLADTTLGGGLYRPPVARDESTLTDLESTGLVRWTEECGFEITDAGKVFVAGRAKEIADSQAYIMYSALPRVEDDTAPLPFTGTLPGLPVVERDQPDQPDHESAMRMLAALKATPSAAELAELAAINTAGWAALGADLADQPSWLRRKLTPPRVLVLSIVGTVVVTWFAAWLVMG